MGHSGKVNVRYRDAKGTTRQAIVVGPGTTSGLKIRVRFVGIFDNVPLATSPNQTNVYFADLAW
jgi:hypothetical protein